MSAYNIYCVEVEIYVDRHNTFSKVYISSDNRFSLKNLNDTRVYTGPRNVARAQLMQRRLMGIKDG